MNRITGSHDPRLHNLARMLSPDEWTILAALMGLPEPKSEFLSQKSEG